MTIRFKKIFPIWKNPVLLSILSAFLLRFSFPKFDIWIFAWLSFVPLFFAVRRFNPVKAFFAGLLNGFVFSVSLIFWLAYVSIPGMLILSFYVAVYTAIFLSLYAFARERLGFWLKLFFAPSLWVFMEFARSYFFTGFPWGLLGYTQSFNYAAIQPADIFGVYGVSFIVMFVNVLIFEFLISLENKKVLNLKKIYICLFIIAVWFSYSAFRIYQDPGLKDPVKISIVQGNIAQELKWVENLQGSIFKKYKLLTELAVLREEPDLVVWPETSFPEYLEVGINDSLLAFFAKSLETNLLIGAIRFDDIRYSNSAVLFSQQGRISGIYNKMHLVPYGEYIPMRGLFPFVENLVPIEDFTAGSDYKVFSLEDKNGQMAKFSVLICFEDIFPDLARGFVNAGAGFLVNMTNDAWFGDTASPYQHMQASIMRAVENRVFVVRAANTGISCIIDDLGRTVMTLKDEEGKATFSTAFGADRVYDTRRDSLYSRIGDVFAQLCILYSLAIMLLCVIRRRA